MSDKSVLLAMDHRECRKRIGQLEDELDYHFGRKEELKKEVKKIQDKYDDVYDVYMKNTKVAMDMNIENAELKAVIEQLEKENIELKTIGKADHIENAESEIKELKATIESDKHEAEEIFNELRAENKNLKVQITTLLECDDCGQGFVENPI